MSVLLDKLRKSRESLVEIGDFTFTVRRPTDAEIVAFRGKQITQEDILGKFIVGWKGVKELDIIPGGDGAEVPFEQELFADWIADKPDLWEPLISAVLASYEIHSQSVTEALKKPEAG